MRYFFLSASENSSDSSSVFGKALAYGLLVGLLVLWGGLELFQVVSYWEDENFQRHAILAYMNGNPLPSLQLPYGPMAVWFYKILYLPLSGGPTAEGVRYISLAIWLFGSSILATICQRQTGSLTGGLLTFLIAFRSATQLVTEPGLAHIIGYFFMSVSLGSWLIPKKPKVVTAAISIAACLFIKINVGVFLMAAFGLLVLQGQPSSSFWDLARKCWTLALLGGPLVLMRRNLADPDFLPFIVLSCILIILTLRATRKLTKLPPQYLNLAPRYFGAWSGAVLVFYLLSLFEGFTTYTLFENLVGVHLKRGTVFQIPPPVDWLTVCCGLIALISTRIRRAAPDFVYPLVLLALLFGLFQVQPIADMSQTAKYAVFALAVIPLLVALQVRPDSESGYPEALVLSVGILQLLSIFPAAGAQLAYSLAMFSSLFFLSVSKKAQRRFPALFPAALLFLVLLTLFEVRGLQKKYRSRVPSLLPRLGQRIVQPETFWLSREWLVWTLMENSNKVFTIPGLFSFSLNSGVESIPMPHWSNFPFGLQGIEASVDQSFEEAWQQKAITIYNPAIANFWNRRRVPPPQSLSKFLTRVVAVAEYNGFAIMLDPDEMVNLKLVGMWPGPKENQVNFALPKNLAPKKISFYDSETGQEISAMVEGKKATLERRPPTVTLRAYSENGKLLIRLPLLILSLDFEGTRQP